MKQEVVAVETHSTVIAAAREPAVLVESELQAWSLHTGPSPSALVQLICQLEGYRRPLRLDELVHVTQMVELARPDLQPYISFLEQTYGDQPVYARDRFEIRCLCWQSRQQSSVHDHRGSRCCVRVVEGVLTNADFARASDGRVKRVCTDTFHCGDVLAREDRQVHQVRNAQPPAHELVTLHIYSPPLASRRGQTEL